MLVYVRKVTHRFVEKREVARRAAELRSRLADPPGLNP
jgi:hypothetical protein